MAFFVLVGCLTICDGTASGGGDIDAAPAVDALTPIFSERDARRTRLKIRLLEIAADMPQITDIQFPPGAHDAMFVARKSGELYVASPEPNRATPRLVAKFTVTTKSELGLLGVALHPEFRANGLMYFNYTVQRENRNVSRIAERRFTSPANPLREGQLVAERIIFEVEQPYANHNAGQLAFGPDGYLYIGWGDGGSREDPKRHGQNPQTYLGAMLRIDPRADAESKKYRVPPDNPYVGRADALPELYAIGLRNPWRFSFDPAGRLIVADVGQDRLEEINIVQAGKNYGWDIREASACHRPKTKCASRGARGEAFVDPVYEYGRDDGRSITGGYVYTGTRIAALKDRYVFGDFVSGRIWAIRLPQNGRSLVAKNAATALGKWPLLISTFGRDNRGEVYVADFGGGKIYRLEPAL